MGGTNLQYTQKILETDCVVCPYLYEAPEVNTEHHSQEATGQIFYYENFKLMKFIDSFGTSQVSSSNISQGASSVSSLPIIIYTWFHFLKAREI